MTQETPHPADTAEEVKPENAALATQVAGADEEEVTSWPRLMQAMEPQFALALRGADGTPLIDPAKFARLALTAIRKNERLQEADQMSLIGAIVTIAQLGLEPSGPLGHAYLVPFKEKGTTYVQPILGYQGMVQLALRSGMIASISARVVRAGDTFDWEYGSNEFLRHKPKMPIDPEADVTAAWAQAKTVTGGAPFVVLDRSEIDRARGRAKTDNIWKSDFEAMARKTAVRQLFRWLPSSVEIRGALGADQGIVRGIPNSLEEQGDVIDIDPID